MQIDPDVQRTQPLSKRDHLRATLLDRIPRWYNPWAHLVFPSLFGLSAIAVALSQLRAPGAAEWSAVPTFWLLLNAVEWRIHRVLLHRRTWPLQQLFDRHTPEHHVVFVKDDMAIRDVREFRLVLIPSYGIVAILASSLPITWALATWVSANIACLWVAVSMFYVVSYEWLHLSYHLPNDSRIGQHRLIRTLRRSHAMHHTPELMQRWNFNVTIPLFDWVAGTIHPGTFEDGSITVEDQARRS